MLSVHTEQSSPVAFQLQATWHPCKSMLSCQCNNLPTRRQMTGQAHTGKHLSASTGSSDAPLCMQQVKQGPWHAADLVHGCTHKLLQ